MQFRFPALLAAMVLMTSGQAATSKSAKSKPLAPSAKPSSTAQRAMKSLTLRERVAQLVIAPCFGYMPNKRTAEFKKFDRWVHDVEVGGLIVVNQVVNGVVRNAEPYQMAAFFNQMQRRSKVPLLIAGDFERGASMRVAQTAKFPHNMAFGATGDPNTSRFLGAETAKEARALGVQWIFAPVADVNNNPDNPIINIRSYSEDPKQVAEHVAAYIEGAHSDPKNAVLVTAKHFPGHGDTAADSHLELAKVGADLERLEAVELMPFRAAIQAGVDAIMTAHVAVPAIESEEIPATVSSKVLTDTLRQKLQFQGLIVTDAMDMAGLAKQFPIGEASVRALEAGADVLLMPHDPEAAINGVMQAIQSGRLSRARVEQSVMKILDAKARLGLFKSKLVDIEALNNVLESPDAMERAQGIADRAVTLVKDEKTLVPLAPANACLIALVERRGSTLGQQLMQEWRARAPKAPRILLDAQLPESEMQKAVDTAAQCKTVVVGAFAGVTDRRGTVALPEAFDAVMQKLLAGPAPVIMVTFGNPYLLRNYPTVAGYMTTFSTAPTAETAAAKALFGEIGIQGKLPVTIPGQAKAGDGIQRLATGPAQ
jgi:beta-N-acetylhexosaminidase